MTGTELQDRINKFLETALENISARDYDKAIEKLKAAEVLDTDNPEIIYNLGICYSKKELYNTAITYFERILDLTFTFVEVITVHKLLAYSLLMIKEFNKAREYINRGLKISENDTTLLNMLGYSYEQENRYDEAMEIYKRIIELDNYNYNAYNSLAYITAKNEDDLNTATEYIKKALKNSPENPAYLDTAGFIYMKKGQTELAKKYLKQALNKMPDSAEIKEHINLLLKIDNAG